MLLHQLEISYTTEITILDLQYMREILMVYVLLAIRKDFLGQAIIPHIILRI